MNVDEALRVPQRLKIGMIQSRSLPELGRPLPFGGFEHGHPELMRQLKIPARALRAGSSKGNFDLVRPGLRRGEQTHVRREHPTTLGQSPMP